MTAAAASDAWAERAGAVPIEDELGRRGIHLRGKIERAGPCPVCGGTDRFSINTEKQLWNCRHCGKGGDIIDLVQHLDGCDFTAACTTLIGERPQAKPNGKANGKNDEQEVKLTKVHVGKWRYEDKAGKLLYEVRRIEYQKPDGSFVLKNGKHEKKFFPYRIDPRTGEGIWKLKIDGVPDVPVVPFGLPELIKNPSAPVFVVEGELKVHALRKWGLVATCNAGGAEKWTAEHAEFLRGRDVAIIPDNDETGRKHAEMVARSLIGIAKEIHIIELPGLGSKEDIVDWIKRGNILETFSLLVEQSKPWAAPRSEAESEPQPDTAAGAEQKEQEPKPRLQWADTSGWDNEPCPDRDWAVLERIPLRQVTLFSGEGAIGKSIAELMLGVAHVTAKDWLGSLPEPGGAFYLGAEDDEKELRIRLTAIAAHYGTTFDELAASGFRFKSLCGEDAILAAPDRSGIIKPTALYDQILEEAGDLKPKHIGIDTSADVFAGSEIDRSQVRQFINLLRRLAIVSNGSVVLLSHPSLTGISTGSGISGSTAWHNSVRSRFYMTASKIEAGEQPDTDLREIVFKKANYSRNGDSLVLRYERGLFLHVAGAGTLDKLAAEQAAEQLFLELLDEFGGQGREVSHKQKANNYAPTEFAKHPKAKEPGIKKATLADAMERLFAAKKIKAEPYGPPSRDNHRVARCDPQPS